MVASESAGRSSLRGVGRALGAVLGLETLLLSITGVALLFSYRPEPLKHASQFGQKGPPPPLLSTRGVHIWTSRLMILTVVITAAVWMVIAARELRPGRWKTPLWCGGLAVAVFAAVVTGLALPWDQLALSTVTTETIRGFGFLRPGASIRALFVLINNTEVSPGTFRLELIAHVAIALVVAVALVAAGLVMLRRRAPKAPPPPFTHQLDALV